MGMREYIQRAWVVIAVIFLLGFVIDAATEDSVDRFEEAIGEPYDRAISAQTYEDFDSAMVELIYGLADYGGRDGDVIDYTGYRAEANESTYHFIQERLQDDWPASPFFHIVAWLTFLVAGILAIALAIFTILYFVNDWR